MTYFHMSMTLQNMTSKFGNLDVEMFFIAYSLNCLTNIGISEKV